MRKTKLSGSFFLCLLINMILNWEGLIPAAVLLVLPFALGWSFWWALAAFGAWLLWMLIWMSVIGWASRCGSTPDPPKENKNPYSTGCEQEKR